MIATALALASTGLLAFAAGVLAGRVCSSREPALREPVRPAEACVEEWTADEEARIADEEARLAPDLERLERAARESQAMARDVSAAVKEWA